MKDGLYRVVSNYFVAGFIVENGVIVHIAPILRKRIHYWKTVATWICN